MTNNTATRLKDLTIQSVKKFSLNNQKEWVGLFDQRKTEFEFVKHSQEIFNILATNELTLVHSYVVSNPHTPASALNIIVDMIVRSEPAAISNHALSQLVKHENFNSDMATRLLVKPYTHSMLAGNLNSKMPSCLFEELNESDSSYVHVMLLRNVNTPLSIHIKHKKYLEDNNKYIIAREFLSNPNTPTDIIQKIYDFGNKFLKDGLVIHPATPKKIVVEIWNEAVSKRKYKTINHVLFKKGMHLKPMTTKALIFHTHKTPPKNQVNHFKLTPTRNQYFTVLKPYYPELTEDVPLEWLKGLADMLQLRHFRVTVEELEKFSEPQ